MPKSPINSRTVYYTIRRDGTMRFADFNLVDTNLGAMVEPALVNELPGDVLRAGALTADLDLDEISFNKLELIDEATAWQNLGTWGNQVPANYNSQ